MSQALSQRVAKGGSTRPKIYGLRILAGLAAMLASLAIFAIGFAWLANAAGGWAFIVLLILLPVFIFFYAVLPALNGLRQREQEDRLVHRYCFGGLDFPRVLTSSIGSLLATGTVLNATLGSLYYAGSAPFIGWTIAVLVFPILLYFLLSSEEVATYFSNDADPRTPMRTVVGYVSSNYGQRSHVFIGLIFAGAVTVLAIVEVGFALLWSQHLFGGRFPEAWSITLLWFVIAFAYVFFGGYYQVLRTDFLQFFVLFFSLIALFVVAVWHFGGDANIGSALSTTYTSFLDEQRMLDIVARRELVSAPDAAWVSVAAGIASFMLMGCWMLCAPDIWYRVSHYLYVQRELNSSISWWPTNRKHRRAILALLLLSLAGAMLVADLLSGFVGTYAFINEQALGLDNGPPQDAPFRTIENILQHFSASSHNVADRFGLVFGNSETLVLLFLLVVIMMLAMTTFDTVIITIVQLVHDMRQGDRPSPVPSSLALHQFVSAIVFVFAIATALVLFHSLSFSGFNTVVSALGLLIAGNLAVLATVILAVRTWFPGLMRMRDRDFVWVYGSAFVVAKFVWGWAIVNRLSIGPLYFEIGVGATGGAVYVVEITVYALFLAGYALFQRRSHRSR